MQPTLTSHCPKLVQYIKIRISCAVRVYTWKILRSSAFSFPPSWIWAIGVSRHSQSHELQKNDILGQNTCIDEILKSYKNSKNLLDVFIYRNCIQRYTKCVAFLELNGVKKKLSSLIMGHFQMRVFAVHATGVQEMYKRWETQIFHILLIWWTLRPLELDVQPMFCRFSSANELEHVWSIDAGLVSCFRGSQ